MLLHDVYHGSAIIDGRAHKRDQFKPSTISVRAMGTGSITEHVNLAVNSTPIPCAYVGPTGEVWILTGGGSGIIAFAGDDPTLEQSDRISLIVEALELLGGEVETLDDPEPVKRSKRKQKSVDVEPEQAADDIADADPAWTVDDEGNPF